MSESQELHILNLRKTLNNSAKEIKNINDEGRKVSSDPSSVSSFKGMFRALERYYTSYESAYNELSSIYEYAEKSTEFPKENDKLVKDNVRRYYYEANTTFEVVSTPPLPIPRSVSRPAESLNATFVSDVSQSLPKIDLPKFDGEILNWPKYRDTFVSMIHKDDNIPVIRKYHYLKLSLSGSALATISHLRMDDATYNLAWQALMEAFDNKRMLASAYLNQILNFKPLQGNVTNESLKSFLIKINDSVSSFRLLEVPDQASFILFHIAIRCLDSDTRKRFELAHKGTIFPTFDQLVKFVQEQSTALQLASGNIAFDKMETSSQNHSSKGNSRKPANKTKPQASLIAQNSSNSLPSSTCIICKKESHPILSCKMFHDIPVQKRCDSLRNWNGCRNCLSAQHKTNSCGSKWNCRWCKKRHNSLLCLALESAAFKESTPTTSMSSPSNVPVLTTGSALSSTSPKDSPVLLGTALVQIKDGRGRYQDVRLVVDSGSHYSFMTQRCMKKLGLPSACCTKRLSGIGQSLFDGVSSQVECTLRPRTHASPNLSTTALIVKEITTFLPTVSLPYHLWRQYLSFPLADPKFFESGPVDFLLGADLFADIWVGSALTIKDQAPKLYPTIFGHVIIGRFSPSSQPADGTVLLALDEQNDLSADLRKFWEIEEPATYKSENPEDLVCNDYFCLTHQRLEDGSYSVRLPFKSSPPDISSTSLVAHRRFQNLEEKLRKQHSLREQYHDFMKEYLDMGHMSPVDSSFPKYTIPHHSVVKEDRNQIKLRVVFDASAQSLNGSLNDYLMTGPKLQKDIKDILLNFRSHAVVFVADVVKMYRNIWLHPADQHYQCIRWRFSPAVPVETYKLNTVTYGLSCSPYLALRVIKQLVIDEGTDFPEASAVLERDIYIDDIVTGADSIAAALHLQEQLIALLKRGCFSLSKWASNRPKLLDNVIKNADSQPISMIPKEDASLKILGLQWDPVSDSFTYNIIVPSNQKSTKRAILSCVARIYDPLGFLAPFVIVLKSLIQEMWKNGLDWDDVISPHLDQQWKSSIEDIQTLAQIRIPRFTCCVKPYKYQIVGFCDASVMSYAAVIYLRTIKDSNIKVHLLTAKTKLAPLKSLTIPRLELSGALLLCQLYSSISGFISMLPKSGLEPRFFTDSTIVLGWINTPTFRLKTFVSNRVSQINEITSTSTWFHIDSSSNPADCASRGLTPLELLNHATWWTGPYWLSLPDHQWPSSTLSEETLELPEVKPDAVLHISSRDQSITSFIRELITRFSSYDRLLRVVARILRLSYKAQRQIHPSGPLQLPELDEALIRCVKLVQLHYFFKDDPSNSQDTISKFVKLNPFFDSVGVLRAGGRLYKANLPFNHKHPILLPQDCHFTDILVDHFHHLYMHPGPSLLQALIQTRFWIPSLRRLVQKRTFLCLKCYKSKVKAKAPMMGDLPSSRLQGIRAFLQVGVDFAGPFSLRESLRRKAAVSKAYMCLFVCMATKAIHLEVVSSLTARGFLAAFDRFSSRRGFPSDVYSDCGTNFIAAARHFKQLWKWFKDSQTQIQVTNHLVQKGIQWHFNPPHSPHFGGLWEAGVKSAKTLFRKAVGETPLSFEEISTLLARIEAVLNSRPLCPLSADPAECQYLSPGHFLIGCPLLSQPEQSLLDCSLNRLDRWQLVQRMSQFFWQRWRIEYLSTLQSRVKWNKGVPNLTTGDLVLLKEDNSSMLHWPAGRIQDIHPGHDGVVRVVTVKTPASVYKRPVVKVVPLLPLSSKPYPN